HHCRFRLHLRRRGARGGLSDGGGDPAGAGPRGTAAGGREAGRAGALRAGPQAGQPEEAAPAERLRRLRDVPPASGATAMARPKKQPAETAGEPTSSEPVAAPDVAAAAQPAETAGAAQDPTDKPKVKKIEMVRQAITVGHKRMPQAIQKWIKENFGQTISTNHISNIKGELRKSGLKVPRKAANEGAEQPPARRNGDGSLS